MVEEMQEGDKCELCNSEPWKTNTKGMGNRNGNGPLPPSKHVRGNPSLAVGGGNPLPAPWGSQFQGQAGLSL